VFREESKNVGRKRKKKMQESTWSWREEDYKRRTDGKGTRISEHSS
jgi:hypothetical protein